MDEKSYTYAEYLKHFVGVDITDGNEYCGNCHVPMHKQLDPIVFSPRPRGRTWWKCPQCGAEVPRRPDEGELDGKLTVYTYPADTGI